MEQRYPYLRWSKNVRLVILLHLSLACSHAAHQGFGDQVTLMVSHTNSPKTGCPDGDSAMLMMQSMAHYLMEDLHKEAMFHACFSKPAPDIEEIFTQFPKAESIYFYDLHPLASSLLDRQALPSLHIYDHHLTFLALDRSHSPWVTLDPSAINDLLKQVSGTHLAAYHFMQLLVKHYQTDHLAWQSLRQDFSQAPLPKQTQDIFGYLLQMAPILAKDENLPAHSPIKKLIQPHVLHILENMGRLDLYSIGEGKNLPPLHTQDIGASHWVNLLAQELMDRLSRSGISADYITHDSIKMGLLEDFFKQHVQFNRTGEEAMLSSSMLQSTLSQLSTPSLEKKAQHELLEKYVNRYDIFPLLQGVGSPSVSPVCLLPIQYCPILNGSTIRIAYLPISPSSGATDDATLKRLKFTPEEQERFKQATQKGAVREIEGYVEHLLHTLGEKKREEKWLLMMEGAHSVSFRANFDMIVYDTSKKELLNCLHQLGIQGGGHPRATGCKREDLVFQQWKRECIEAKTLQ